MLPGISGNLLPLQFISNHLQFADHSPSTTALATAPTHPPFSALWRRISATCGPATGLRALVDLAAMPLVAQLGFAASSADFSARVARFALRARTPRPPDRHAHAEAPRSPQSQPIALLVAPWANRSPAIWRDAIEHARALAADWCLIVAPPVLQIVDARAHWSRQFLEFSLSDAAEHPGTFARLAALAGPAALDNSGDASLRQIVAAAAKFQDQVRADLQLGVVASLDALGGVRLPHGESLAIVYRVLFLLFVESRDLIAWRHPLYRPAYSIGTLCDTARRDPRSPGFWDGLAAVSRLLRSGCRTPRLDVPPFNGRLFSRAAAPTLERPRATHSSRAGRDDAAIAATLLSLSTRATRYGRETIAYPDLGVEQLGAVYERVLGLPDRKQSGTFYTPRALTEFVVRDTLAPLTRSASADQILDLKILDPSMGSGAFLVAACRHLAAAYERALVREHRLSESEIDDALQSEFRRLVAQRCLYGVDKNPTAVELARLSLWLATLARGKPLSFLDHRLRAGDALIGARPEDLRFAGDRRRHRTAPLPLFDLDASLEAATGRAVTSLRSFDAESDDTVEAVRRKEATWSRLVGESSSLRSWRLASDLWCARWFAGAAAPSPPELRAAIDALVRGDATLPPGPLTRWLLHAKQLSGSRGFFHWPLEFADVFFDADGRSKPHAGFDAVVGNPPWEMLRTDHAASGESGGETAGTVRFIRDSGVFAHSGHGHVNLYQPFLERALSLTRRGGRVGLVLPWGLASDDGAAPLRALLLDRCATSSMTGFDNREGIFPVHRGVRFLALATSPGASTTAMKMSCGITRVEQLEHTDRSSVRVTTDLIARIGGRPRRFPDIRGAGDLGLLERLTSRFPPVGSPKSYGASFGRELNITEDKRLFGARGLPVIEGKHIQPFVTDAAAARFRISLSAATSALPDRAFARPRLAYRDISAVGNRQALIAAVVPADVVTTHTIFCLETPLPLEQQHFLCACFNSGILNRFVRLLMGGHLTTSLVEGLPVPPWTGSRRQKRIAQLTTSIASDEAGRSIPLLADLLAREFETY